MGKKKSGPLKVGHICSIFCLRIEYEPGFATVDGKLTLVEKRTMTCRETGGPWKGDRWTR